jgi:hypothetical protein
VELRQAGKRWLCVAHDPERRKHRESRRRAATTRPPVTAAVWPLPDDQMPATQEQCRIVGSWAQRELVRGGIDARTAHELAALVRATLKAIEDSRGAEDVAALKTLLEELDDKKKGPGVQAMRARGHAALARSRMQEKPITEESTNADKAEAKVPVAAQGREGEAAPHRDVPGLRDPQPSARAARHAGAPDATLRAHDAQSAEQLEAGPPDGAGRAAEVVTAPAVVTLQAFGQEHVAFVPPEPPPAPVAPTNNPNSAFRSDGSPKSNAELMRDAVDPNRFIYKGLPGRETS